MPLTVLVRSITPAELELRDDGRTVEGLIVPYDEPAPVVDIHPQTGKRQPFTEVFTRGAIARQLQMIDDKLRGRPNYIRLNLDHGEDLPRQIGYARSLTEASDGAHATFGLYDRPDLDLIRSMLKESHDGLSVEFVDHGSSVDGDYVYRRSVEVRAVAATPMPTYRKAKVLAVREDVGEEPPEIEELPPLRTPDLDHYREIFG
jgi:phage head maturation protease